MTARIQKAESRDSPPAFRIRPLTPADFTALLRYDWSPLVAERDTVYLFLTRDHARYCLVAEDEAEAGNKRPLGYLVAARSSDGKAAFVFQVHVRPQRRREGVGTALVRKFEETAERDGVRLVWFLARREARGFYSALGYLPSDELLHPEAAAYVARAKRTTVMTKRLGKA